jgi:hypothetical protein
MVRPVNHAAALIPFITPMQPEVRTPAYRDAFCKVDIMGHQHGMTAVQRKNKALVA